MNIQQQCDLINSTFGLSDASLYTSDGRVLLVDTIVGLLHAVTDDGTPITGTPDIGSLEGLYIGGDKDPVYAAVQETVDSLRNSATTEFYGADGSCALVEEGNYITAVFSDGSTVEFGVSWA